MAPPLHSLGFWISNSHPFSSVLNRNRSWASTMCLPSRCSAVNGRAQARRLFSSFAHFMVLGAVIETSLFSAIVFFSLFSMFSLRSHLCSITDKTTLKFSFQAGFSWYSTVFFRPPLIVSERLLSLCWFFHSLEPLAPCSHFPRLCKKYR